MCIETFSSPLNVNNYIVSSFKAPCPPENVSAQFNCSSNDMTVSWNANGDADHFLVSVTSSNGGFSKSCNTTSASCSISNVTCGYTFHAQVTPGRGDCIGQQSQSQSVSSGMKTSNASACNHPFDQYPDACVYLSAPCQPQGVRGNLDCVTNSALISWDATPGADSNIAITVNREDQLTNYTTCSTNPCEVKDLRCGARYNFSVTAKNAQCESRPSATINLRTGEFFSFIQLIICH